MLVTTHSSVVTVSTSSPAVQVPIRSLQRSTPPRFHPRAGDISVDVVTDFQTGVDTIDLGLIDANTTIDGQQGFTFVNSGKGNAGELWTKTFGNINAAEKSLGIDIPGYDGPNPQLGHVTVVFGDVDGGGADFAFVLIGTKSIALGDFVNLAGGADPAGTLSVALSQVLASSAGDVSARAALDTLFEGSSMDDLLAATFADHGGNYQQGQVDMTAFASEGDRLAQFGAQFGMLEGGRLDDMSHMAVIA